MKVAEAKTTATAAKSNSPFFQKGAAQSLLTTEEAPQPFFQKKQSDHINIQAKLSIGQPNDKYEQEADAMADKVVQKLSTGNDVSEKKSPDNIQPKPLAADITPLVQQKHEPVEEEKLQKKEEEPDALKAGLQQKPIFESNAEVPPDADADVQRKCDACEHEEEEKLQKKSEETQPNDKQVQEVNPAADKAVQLQAIPAAVKVNDASADIQAKPVAAVHAVQKAVAFDEEEKQKKEEEGDLLKGELQKKTVFEGNAEAPPDDEKDVQRKCGVCENEEEKKIQKKGDSGAADVASPSVESSLSSSKGSGSPLPESARSEMEDSFGADFSGVRIHNDSNAAQMSKDLNAQAFTHQNDIYFNTDKYNPQTPEGRHLLAHELTHTIQQGGAFSKEQGKSAAPERIAPKIQRSIIDDVASYLLTGNAVLDFIEGVGAGILEWFGDLISGIVSLFSQAFEGSIGAILGIIGIIIVIVLACVFPEVVVPILIGVGIVMGLISMAYFLYMMTRPGLTPYERGKYLGKAIVEAALLAFTVLEAVRLFKTFAEVAKLAEGVGLLQRLRWVRQLMRFGETTKVLEILAEIRDIEKTIEFLTIVNDVSKAQELLRLTRGAGQLDLLLEMLRIEGMTADDLIRLLGSPGMDLDLLKRLLRNLDGTPRLSVVQLESLLSNAKLADAAQLERLLSNSKIANVAQLESLLANAKLNDGALLERLLSDAKLADAAQLENLLNNAKIADGLQIERLLGSAKLADAAQLERLLNNAKIADGLQIERMLGSAKLADAAQLERLLGNAKVADGLQIERLLGSTKLTDAAQLETLLNNAKLADGAQLERMLGNAKVADAAQLERLFNNAKLADGAQLERLLANAKVADAAQLERLLDNAKLADAAQLERLLANAKLLDAAQLERLINIPKVTDAAQIERLLSSTKIPDATRLERLLANANFPDVDQMERLLALVDTVDDLERYAALAGGSSQLARLENILRMGVAKGDAKRVEDILNLAAGNAGIFQRLADAAPLFRVPPLTQTPMVLTAPASPYVGLTANAAAGHFLDHTFEYVDFPSRLTKTLGTTFWPAGTSPATIEARVQEAVNVLTSTTPPTVILPYNAQPVNITGFTVQVGIQGTSPNIRIGQFFATPGGGGIHFSMAEMNALWRLLIP